MKGPFFFLKGSSENCTVDLFAGYFAECEARVHSFTWLATVPSKSNIADPPSRNSTSAAFFENATDVSAEAKVFLYGLLTRLNEDGETGLVTRQISKKKPALMPCVWKGLHYNVTVA